ncbi:hypothetical protein FINN_76 [Bacillus phage Finn]|uniref:Uncharacterized protein n=1 Tax=Bacillus phage Finn TaxID=2884419 RepID=M1IEJ1_9CAUD|nr:hypothetical protein FINN_76 [Bacillus phage Finn]AGE61069.1 hypothetical protein FINN_76 [Bacillus phage Finn]
MCNWLKQKGEIFRFIFGLISKERTSETAKKETSKVKLYSRVEEAKLKS